MRTIEDILAETKVMYLPVEARCVFRTVLSDEKFRDGLMCILAYTRGDAIAEAVKKTARRMRLKLNSLDAAEVCDMLFIISF